MYKLAVTVIWKCVEHRISVTKTKDLHILTHISFILKGISTPLPPAVEMRGPLPSEDTMRGRAAFCGPEPLETFLEDCGVLTVVVCVHLDV